MKYLYQYRLCLVVVLLALSACEVSKEQEDEALVYIDDSAIQCGFEGYSVTQTAQLLIDNGIDVLNSQCAYISNLLIAAACGLGNNNIHLHSINRRNLVDANVLAYHSVDQLSHDGAQGYEIIDCR